MTSKSIAYAAVIIVVVLVVAFGAYSGKFNQTPPAQNINLPYQQGVQNPTQNNQPATSSCPAGQAPNGAGTCTPIGQVTVTLVMQSGINSGTTYTTTNIAATYYSSSDGKSFAQIGSGSGNALTITPSMGGIFYMQLKPASGSQHYYIMPNQIMNPALNPSITAFDFIDPTNTGTKYWLFQINLAKAYLPPLVAGQTSPTLTLYVLADPYGALTANSYTASVLNQATSALSPATILYYGSLAATQEANAISEIDMKMNTTTTSDWDTGSSYIQVPNVGNVYLNQMSMSQDGTNTYYKYYFNAPISTSFGVSGNSQSNNFKGADYVVIGATGANSIPFTFNLSTNQPASGGIAYTMTIYSLDDTQATQSSAKTICVSAQAAC